MPMTYYELELPPDLAPGDFESLMADDVSPLLDTQQTRVGAVEGGSLFRSLEGGNRYIWGIEWSGVGGSFVDDRTKAAVEALARHGVQVRALVESDSP